ncbi:MAG TPA: hypothetical protein VMU50_19995 [Polyangia bacterium]|nr:hypothetical protein [Polyangia bacterium]
MMNVFRMYARTAAEAARLAVRAWPLALALPAYGGLLIAVLLLTSSLGVVGGIAAGFGMAAIGSSYLHLLALAVSDRRIGGSDIKESFGARIWDVVSVMFAFWIINLLVGALVSTAPKGPIIAVLIGLAMAVFFNPVPELLYQSATRSFALLIEAARFISARGLEWLFPNLILGVVLLLPTGVLGAGVPMGERVLRLTELFSIAGLLKTILGSLVFAPLLLVFLHWAMIFRGLLFRALTSGGGRPQAVRDIWGSR